MLYIGAFLLFLHPYLEVLCAAGHLELGITISFLHLCALALVYASRVFCLLAVLENN